MNENKVIKIHVVKTAKSKGSDFSDTLFSTVLETAKGSIQSDQDRTFSSAVAMVLSTWHSDEEPLLVTKYAYNREATFEVVQKKEYYDNASSSGST